MISGPNQPRTSKLQAFQVKLTLDQKFLETISTGYGVLGDCLDWITTQKKLALAKQAKTVVADHMKVYGPVMPVEGFETLPGDLQTLLGQLPSLSGGGKRLVVYHLDFNVPNVSWTNVQHGFIYSLCCFLCCELYKARNALMQAKMITALANCCRTQGLLVAGSV